MKLGIIATQLADEGTSTFLFDDVAAPAARVEASKKAARPAVSAFQRPAQRPLRPTPQKLSRRRG